MSSRMDKYRDNPEFFESRAKKNEVLYQEIIHDDLEDINLESNAHVIGENEKSINIEKIKELLEKKYPSEQRNSRTPRPLSRDLDYEYEEKNELDEEETKEYDINAIIEKAKLDKDVDYERERLKKIRDTQYDILKGLDLDEDYEAPASVVTSNKDDLMHLINTITEKELTREMNPLDLLTDLKGSDNTVVLDGVKKEIDKEVAKQEIKDTVRETVKDTVKEEVKKEIDKTFYTNSLSFTKSDFDDFNDLKEDIESNKLLVRILLFIVVIALFAGILFLANHVLDLRWF